MLEGEIIENCYQDQFKSDSLHHPYTTALLELQKYNYDGIEEVTGDFEDTTFIGCKYYINGCPDEKRKILCNMIAPPPIDVASGEIVDELAIDKHWIKCWKFRDE